MSEAVDFDIIFVVTVFAVFEEDSCCLLFVVCFSFWSKIARDKKSFELGTCTRISLENRRKSQRN